MKITGPTPVTFVAPSTSIVVNGVTFDMRGHTYSLSYSDPTGAQQKTVSGDVPPDLYAVLAVACQRQIEIQNGWAASSSTVDPSA